MTRARPTFAHKRIAVDFDGTLFEDCPDIEQSYRERTPLAPLPGASDATKWLKAQGFELLVFTCRPDYHRSYLEGLMTAHDIAHDYILFYTKPRVDLYVDDRGFRFESWHATREWIAARLQETERIQFQSQQPSGAFEQLLRRAKWNALRLAPPAVLLDVGSGDGAVFESVEGFVVDAVEPDAALRAAAARSGRYRAVHAVLSEVDPAGYDVVLALGVLEHVDDPAVFLDALGTARVICLTVPNAESFHRRFGVELGMLGALTELQAHDHAVGHQRYFNVAAFRTLVEAFAARAGFEITRFGTCSFKVSSSSEMMRFADRVDALNRTAESLGLIGEGRSAGAEIYCRLDAAKR